MAYTLRPKKYPTGRRDPNPAIELRTDLRDMYPKKKRTPVKPIGNPNQTYLVRPATTKKGK